MTAPPVAEATHSLSRVSHPGGRSASAFQARIIDHCVAHGIEITNGKARKLSIRLARRAERQQEEFDFFAALRILGIQSDPTARTAAHKAECERAECDTCGRTRGER